VAALTSCGKNITISDSTAKSAAPARSAPAATGQPVGNQGLQVLDSTAAQAGRTGTGGTVVGAAVQEQPPLWVQLSAVTSPPLSSPHLININQAALYRFDIDTPNSGQSACNDSCATRWPPVTIQQGGNVYLAGVDSQEVGAIKRQDGTLQLTVGGMPVYRFSGDSKPGDLNGQGIGGTWFVVGPTGDRVTQ
jgi:predicted lipoprotein with Yx(FWY)xxD motif